MALAQVKDVMTEGIASLPSSASIVAAACMMRDRNIGDVLVTDSDRQRCGVVTDRGIVLRAFAADDDRAQMTLRDVSFVTIGDLTRAQDSPSALADISAAAPSN